MAVAPMRLMDNVAVFLNVILNEHMIYKHTVLVNHKCEFNPTPR